MSKSKQITLFGGNDPYWEIKKHSSLVQIGNFDTLLQRKLMNVVIWITRDQLRRDEKQIKFGADIGLVRRLA